MDEHTTEISTNTTLRAFKFQNTFEIGAYQDLLQVLSGKAGRVESRTFSVGQNKEVQLMVTWYPWFNANNVWYAKVCITSVKQKPTEIWMTGAECGIKRPNGQMPDLGKFPTPSVFVQGNAIELLFASHVCNGIHANPALYLTNGSLILVISGTVHIPCIGGHNNTPNEEPKIPSSSSAVAILNTLFESQKFNDVEISCDGRNFSAHKNILWARSSTFAKMFDEKSEEGKAKSNIITVEDFTADVFQEGLLFMYTGKCPKIKEFAKDLLKFGEKFEIPDLKTLCEEELLQSITIENVCDWFVVADEQFADTLRFACLKFIKSNIKAVMVTPAWKALRKMHSDIVSEVFETMVLGDDL